MGGHPNNLCTRVRTLTQSYATDTVTAKTEFDCTATILQQHFFIYKFKKIYLALQQENYYNDLMQQDVEIPLRQICSSSVSPG